MIEVLKQMQEALEYYGWHTDDCDTLECDCGYDKTITSLRQAIAELESQEPVAWITGGGNGELWWHQSSKFDEEGNLIGNNPDDIPLYTSPPQRQPHYDKTEMNAFVQNLYDQKMREGKHGHYETMFHVVHKAIEQACGIKEKNNG